MGSRDAELVIGADTSQVEKAASVAIDAWRNAGNSISAGLSGVGRSLADIVLHSGKINFASQYEQVKQFEAASAHLAVAMGGDLEKVRSDIEATGVAIGKRPAEVAAWTKEVGSLTYNFSGAQEAMRGMAGLAAQTGRSVEDYKGLAVELGTVGKVTGDTTHALGVMAAQAEKLGVKGGVAAFADQVESLSGTISQFSVKSEKDFLKITALAGELGKNLDPQAAQRVAQQGFGAIASDPMRWSRFLHRDILDAKTGQVEDPSQVMKDVATEAKRRYGKNALYAMRYNFGGELGTAMYNADYGKAAEMAGLSPSNAPQEHLGKFLNTDAGKRDVSSAHLAESSRALMGSSTALGRAADALEHFASSSPLAGMASTFAATMAGGAISASIGKVIGGALKGIGGAVGGVLGGGGGTSAVAGSGGLDLATNASRGVGGKIGAAGAVLAAGALGYEVGTFADEQLGISDWISGTGEHSRVGSGQNQAQVMAGASARTIAASKTSAALHASGLSGESLGEATNAAAALNTRGQEVNQQALMTELLKRGNSEEDAQRIARAVSEAMKQVKITIVNGTGGPIGAVNDAGEAGAAGSQAQ